MDIWVGTVFNDSDVPSWDNAISGAVDRRPTVQTYCKENGRNALRCPAWMIEQRIEGDGNLKRLNLASLHGGLAAEALCDS